MAINTSIQWCHSTVNPCMGCLGCEIYPPPGKIITRLDRELSEIEKSWRAGLVAEILRQIIHKLGANLPDQFLELTTTNIYHVRMHLNRFLSETYSATLGQLAQNIIEEMVKCYAARLHLSKAFSIVNPTRHANKGYAPTFESITRFPGRVLKMAQSTPPKKTDSPWLDGQPHLIFLSDMGDALSRVTDFEFLLEDTIPAIVSSEGSRKMWLWLSKRPKNMAAFAMKLEGLPQNICAITTITSRETLYRVDELRTVKASSRGLSIEPLWERIPAEELDLTGIDWVIVGGESGKYQNVKLFQLEWAEELRNHCRENGVAFFMKQLGRKPFYRGKELTLKDKHGGEWSEWPDGFAVREFPECFKRLTNQNTEKFILI